MGVLLTKQAGDSALRVMHVSLGGCSGWSSFCFGNASYFVALRVLTRVGKKNRRKGIQAPYELHFPGVQSSCPLRCSLACCPKPRSWCNALNKKSHEYPRESLQFGDSTLSSSGFGLLPPGPPPPVELSSGIGFHSSTSLLSPSPILST